MVTIVALADRALREQRSPDPEPTADYDEVLLVRDERDLFYLQGFGPIRGGAGELVERLRALSFWADYDSSG